VSADVKNVLQKTLVVCLVLALLSMAAGCASNDEAGTESAGIETVTSEGDGGEAVDVVEEEEASASSESSGQENARRSAESYLQTSPFSRAGLIKQLKYEGYSVADATYAVDAISPDWNEQAAKSAESYLDMSGFSTSGLIKQLEYEGYTHAQAVYGANQVGLSDDASEEDAAAGEQGSGESPGQENARRSAESYLETAAFSRAGLIKQLEYEGYSTADATGAVDALSTDWNAQAVKAAKNYLEVSPFSRSGLIEQLKYEGYTQEQAVYGVSQAGL
jgi:hypothetical protein